MFETSKNCINNIQFLGLDKVLQKQALYMKAPTIHAFHPDGAMAQHSTVFRSECRYSFIHWSIRRRCAKPHGVNHRPVTAVKRVPSRASPCGICGTPELHIAPVSIIAPNLRTCHRQYVTLINSVVKLHSCTLLSLK